MALDPQIAPIVEAVEAAAQAAPPIAEQTVAERRAGYQALAGFAGSGPELDEVRDLLIPGADGDIGARLYRNEGARGIFVFYHGGGYTIGDLDTHDQLCRQLALESETTLISVDYRLAPETPFPGGVMDAWAALQWANSQRQTLGGSPTAGIVIGGDSAGGNFTAVVALMARQAGLELAGQMLIYPAVDMDDDSPSMTENGSGYVLSRETMEWFEQCYAPDRQDWRASPILASSHHGLAPAVIITAQYDPLRDQGRRYADVLTKAGVEVTYSEYPGMVHIFFQLGPVVAAGARAVSQVAQASRDLLDRDS